MKMTALSLAILVATVMSCEKEHSAPGTCATDMATITGSYKTTAISYKTSSAATEQDLFTTLDACEKDDIVKLNANGTADYQDAGSVCTPSGNYTSTWSLSGNTITMDGTQGMILLFDCKKLVVTTSGAIIPGDIFTVTYEKQ